MGANQKSSKNRRSLGRAEISRRLHAKTRSIATFWALDHEMICAATDWACTEMLRSGITGFYDCLEAPYAIPEALFAQKEVVDRIVAKPGDSAYGRLGVMLQYYCKAEYLFTVKPGAG